MIDGIKAGADGMRLMSLKLDSLAANMANSGTTAYKKTEVQAEAADGGGLKVSGYTDLTQGEMVNTANPLDLALQGDGFFVAGEGEARGYTRDGRFTIGAGGKLSTYSGQPVQGEGGPIVLDPSADIKIASDGTVTQNGKKAGQIKITGLADPSALTKGAGGLLTGEAETKPASAFVRQGFTEGSNVRVVEEMASLMQIMRAFESMQKSVTIQDNATGKLTSSLGRF